MIPNENLQKACSDFAKSLVGLITALQQSSCDRISASIHETEDDKKTKITSGLLPQRMQEEVCVDGNTTTSTRRLHVYLAGCRGLADLARTRGSKIMAALELPLIPYLIKCGTTTIPLDARLRQIGQDHYGAAIRTTGGIIVEPGFTRWIAHAVTTSQPARDPSITLLPRAIAVDLPKGLTRRVFDRSLHRCLKERCLDRLPASVMPKRYVAYDMIETRLSAATEIYALSPHEVRDCDLVLEAIESILSRFKDTKAT